MFIAFFNKNSPCFVQYQTSNKVAIQKKLRDRALNVTVERVVAVYPVPSQLKGLGERRKLPQRVWGEALG